MKILITGGAGFVGSHVAEEFLGKARENRVVILDNLSTGKMENIEYLWDKFAKERVKFIKGDVSKKETFEMLGKDLKMEKEGIYAIVHLAAIVSVPQSIDNPIETNNVTLGGSINIFEFAKKMGIKKIIQASSAAVYGDIKKLPIKESDAKIEKQLSPYAISKFTSEMYADYYEKLFDIKTVSLRFFNVYGPRQNPNSVYSGVISKFVKAFQEKGEINIFGDGKNVRDFIYVEDVANTIISLINKKINKNAVYNLGTGKGVNLLLIKLKLIIYPRE